MKRKISNEIVKDKDADVTSRETINSKNNKKPLIILVVVLSLLVLGMGGYLIYDKVIVNKEPGINENEKDNSKDESKENEEEVKESSLKCDGPLFGDPNDKEVCSADLKLKDKIVKVTVTNSPIPSDENDTEHFASTQIEADGKKIFAKEMAYVSRVTTFQDLFVVEVGCTNCGGGSAALQIIQVLDVNGNQIMTLNELSEIFTMGYDFDIQDNGYNYALKDDKIIVTASRVGYFANYGPFPSYDCIIYGDRTENGTDVTGENYSEYADAVVKIVYEFKYLENAKFAPAKNVKEIKFKDLYSKDHCIAEMKEIEKIRMENDF